jgi:hypothetical protein
MFHVVNDIQILRHDGMHNGKYTNFNYKDIEKNWSHVKTWNIHLNFN